MRIDERTYAALPEHLRALFRKAPNPAKAEVLEAFARFGEKLSGGPRGGAERADDRSGSPFGKGWDHGVTHGDIGTAARFYFCAKADASERIGSHPTVKPVALMEWLVRLVTPPGGRVLDCFVGTGSTLVACDRLGFDALGIELSEQYVEDAKQKIARFRARRFIGSDVKRQAADPAQMRLFDV